LDAEENFGAVALAELAASETKEDVWVAFSRAKKDANLVTLTSISNGDGKLTKSDQLRNDRSYLSYAATPKSLRWDQVRELVLDYEVVTVPSFSGDPHLGDLKFVDCQNNSFYIKVELTDGGKHDAGYLIIQLGSKSTGFTGGCSKADLPKNIIADTQPRVDAKKLGATKPITIAESQKAFGALYVKSISIVVDKGAPQTGANYKVRVHAANINGYKARNDLPIIGTSGEEPKNDPKK